MPTAIRTEAWLCLMMLVQYNQTRSLDPDTLLYRNTSICLIVFLFFNLLYKNSEAFGSRTLLEFRSIVSTLSQLWVSVWCSSCVSLLLWHHSYLGPNVDSSTLPSVHPGGLVIYPEGATLRNNLEHLIETRWMIVLLYELCLGSTTRDEDLPSTETDTCRVCAPGDT